MEILATVDWDTIVTYVITAFITVELGYYAWAKRDWIHAYRNISWRLLLVNIVVNIVIVTTVMALYSLNQEIFGISWLNLLGGQGTNLYTAGTRIKYFSIVFCLIALLALPYLARIEEEMFRDGTKTWAQGIKRSIWFGFIHMFMGIPLAAAIALIWAGLFYTYCYFKGGLKLSTQAHFQSNLILFMLLLIFAVINAVQ